MFELEYNYWVMTLVSPIDSTTPKLHIDIPEGIRVIYSDLEKKHNYQPVVFYYEGGGEKKSKNVSITEFLKQSTDEELKSKIYYNDKSYYDFAYQKEETEIKSRMATPQNKYSMKKASSKNLQLIKEPDFINKHFVE
jgi:hypothetical protein